jgi:hypothetical protein
METLPQAVITRSKQRNDSKPKSTISSVVDFITQYDSLVVFGGLGVSVLAVIIITGIFQAGPVIRSNILYNAFGAILMGAMFIYIIFTFMGAKLNLFGKKIDIGMIIYIGIVFFIMFILGN